MIPSILYSNLSIGILVFSQVIAFSQHQKPWSYAICTAFAAITLYNAQRLIKNRKIPFETMSSRHLWIQGHKKKLSIFVVFTFALTLALLPSAFQDIRWQWWMMIPLFCGLLYAGIPATTFQGLREIPGIKSFLVALLWTLITFYIPHHHNNTESENTTVFTHQFLFFWIIAIWFDWRDRTYDPPYLFTLPQLIGTKGTIWINLLVWVIIIWIGIQINSDWLYIDLCLAALQLSLALYTINSKKTELILGLGMDGLIALQAIILLMV